MAFPAPQLPAVEITSGSQAKLYLAPPSTDTITPNWQAAWLMPTLAEVQFTPQGSVESVPIHGVAFDRAVKNGLGGTFTWRSLAPANNPVVSAAVTAGNGVGPDAQMLFVIEIPEGDVSTTPTYIFGACTVESATPQTPVRGTKSWQFNATVDGGYQTEVAPVTP